MKTVKITRDSVAKIIDFPQEIDKMQAEIGANLVERVKTRTIINLFGPNVSFLRDEEFWLKLGGEMEKNLNIPASMLYNGTILGDVFFVKEEGEDWVGFDSVELLKVVLVLKDYFGAHLKWEDNRNE